MARPVKAPRSYDSSRRQAQADENRLAILRAAHDLFLKHGYGRTTIADIAGAAGVSVETIYAAFKNKATLLHRTWDITIGGDDREIVFHERPEVMAARAERDLAKRLLLQAHVSGAAAARIGPFFLMVHAASGAEPAAATMVEEMHRQRLAGLSVMASEAAATGQLAVSEEECRDVLWATTDGVLWQRLVQQRGWTQDRYVAWLGRTWVRLLVEP
ncbi:MAG: TetR family transcriptional regulator [Acidimicrobiales bacterium]|nr:TetR family transcriptional regulator [Acidimicrobiales bacterium]